MPADSTLSSIFTLHGTAFACLPDYRQALADAGLHAHGPWFSLALGDLVNQTPIDRTGCLSLPDGRQVYVKCYRPAERFASFLRLGKATVEALSYQALARAGIPTAKVVALGERRRYGSLQEAFIVTEALPDTISLEDFSRLHSTLPAAELQPLRRQLLAILAAQLRQAHAAGFVHRDLKWRNVLIRYAPPATPALFWIDAPNGSSLPWLRPHGRLLDLSALTRLGVYHLSRGERLRFLSLYAGLDPSHPKVRQLYRQAYAHFLRKPQKSFRKPQYAMNRGPS